MKTWELNWQTGYEVKEKDLTGEDIRVFDTGDDAEEYFRACFRFGLEREFRSEDEAETDAFGRTEDDCVADGEADFGDYGVKLKEVNLYTRKGA